MSISEVMIKMIDFSEGNMHDISHFIKVHSYAKLIGESEKIDSETQEILEAASIVHDIACPLCRKKYGNTNGKYQEEEGMPITAEFFKDSGYSKEFIDRVVFLVGHHHTIKNIEGMDYQILIEADYLVNADESSYSEENIRNVLNTVFKTETGKRLLKSMYKL